MPLLATLSQPARRAVALAVAALYHLVYGRLTSAPAALHCLCHGHTTSARTTPPACEVCGATAHRWQT